MIAARLDCSRRGAGDSAAAAGHVRNARRAAKFPGHDDEHALVEAARVDVFDERRHRLIVNGSPKLIGLEDVMVDRMIVPVRDATAECAVERRGDDIDPRFDQPAGHQALLPPLIAAVTIANRSRFEIQIERTSRQSAGQQIERLRFVHVHGAHQIGTVDLAAKLVEPFPQTDPLEQSFRLAAILEADVGNLERGIVGIARHREGLIG